MSLTFSQLPFVVRFLIYSIQWPRIYRRLIVVISNTNNLHVWISVFSERDTAIRVIIHIHHVIINWSFITIRSSSCKLWFRLEWRLTGNFRPRLERRFCLLAAIQRRVLKLESLIQNIILIQTQNYHFCLVTVKNRNKRVLSEPSIMPKFCL